MALSSSFNTAIVVPNDLSSFCPLPCLDDDCSFWIVYFDSYNMFYSVDTLRRIRVLLYSSSLISLLFLLIIYFSSSLNDSNWFSFFEYFYFRRIFYSLNLLFLKVNYSIFIAPSWLVLTISSISLLYLTWNWLSLPWSNIIFSSDSDEFIIDFSFLFYCSNSNAFWLSMSIWSYCCDGFIDIDEFLLRDYS